MIAAPPDCTSSKFDLEFGEHGSCQSSLINRSSGNFDDRQVKTLCTPLAPLCFGAALAMMLLVANSSSAVADDTAGGEEVHLFDGTTLDGWNGDEKWFRVENGEIIAGSATERIPHNQFLCTNKTYGDFELTVDAKMVGKGNNAGVQFRTKRIPNDSEVIGYQADIGWVPQGTCWGALYDESRRRKFLAESPEVALKVVKRGDWNTLRVIAKGDHIQIYLNGQKTVDYREPDKTIERSGVIALQVHSGPPLEVHYRNVRIREL